MVEAKWAHNPLDPTATLSSTHVYTHVNSYVYTHVNTHTGLRCLFDPQHFATCREVLCAALSRRCRRCLAPPSHSQLNSHHHQPMLLPSHMSIHVSTHMPIYTCLSTCPYTCRHTPAAPSTLGQQPPPSNLVVASAGVVRWPPPAPSPGVSSTAPQAPLAW